ncbi:MAG: VacJ family lipoprotein [Nitrospirae bacterium]|nr:VacJ family lipoprotein [Candidatus Manganitrophaceae bacterium]
MINRQTFVLFFVIFSFSSFFGCATVGGPSQVESQTLLFVQAPGDTLNDAQVPEEDEGFDAFEDEFTEAGIPTVSDPLSAYNRAMTKFNDKFFDMLLSPASRGYSAVVPEGGRGGVRRFFKNLFYPLRFTNNVLQVKYEQAAVETARFLVNSTVGLLGFFDPAKEWFDLEAYPEDFGQTLGFYGVGPGFHLVLPFLGPSNLRDTIGLIPDAYMIPTTYLSAIQISGTSESDRVLIAIGVESYRRLNDASLSLEEYESLRRDALDLYTFLRDAYERNRQVKIKE